MTRQTVITDADIREIRRLYTVEGWGQKRIARHFRTDIRRVRSILPDASVRKGFRALTPAQVIQLREDYASAQRKMTMAELGAKLGLSETATKKVLSGRTYKDVGGPLTSRESYREYRKQFCKRGHDQTKNPPGPDGVCKACRALLRANRLGGLPATKQHVTVRQVIAIREDFAAGRGTLTDLARTYGVHRSTITNIVRGLVHADLPGPITQDTNPQVSHPAELVERIVAMRQEYRKHPGEVTLDQLGASYGFTYHQTESILRGRTFKDVGGPITSAAWVRNRRKRWCKRNHDKSKHPLANGQCWECRRMTVRKYEAKRYTPHRATTTNTNRLAA